MPFESASRTFAMMGYVNSIALRLKRPSLMNDVPRQHPRRRRPERLRLRRTGGDGWDELMPELVQFVIMDDVSAYIFDFILFMIVAFGILNTIQMSVFERTREFGIMLAIGTRPEQVTAMVLLETLFISLIGVALGLALGSATGWYFAVNPIDYSDYAAEMSVWGVSTTVFPAKITALNILCTFTFTMVFSALFAYFPARRASKLSPVEAIRHL
jgi:ABC-type antimicrobial peptide transport system permease subunit